MKIGIIGGSGLYEMSELSNVKKVSVDTPFGPPSDSYISGLLGKNEVFFLPRHGRSHTISPSEINHRANIFGFKKLGVEQVISVSAVGSLREKYKPRDIFLPDQYFDRTKKSEEHTFFSNGIVAHIAFGDPVCVELRERIHRAAMETIQNCKDYENTNVYNGGTYVNMEGPAFSTKAESFFYRKCGFDVIGMTSLPEAKLCREAEICYAAMAMVTDYDCWHETEEAVSVDVVIANIRANTALAIAVLKKVVSGQPAERTCGCTQALNTAFITQPPAVSPAIKKILAPIIGKYIS